MFRCGVRTRRLARYHRGVSGAHGRSPRRVPLRRVARLVGWNALILFGLLLLAAGGAEVWLRLTVPFRGDVAPVRLAPGVGFMRPPHREYRITNGIDFWQVSRTNRLGFLDREPPDAERAAESCHVTLIGDSFVEGREVAIGERAQVRLEELAARELPALDVTTSAFGFIGIGQISQLAFYDAFARGLSPNVVALVAVDNDFYENSLPLYAHIKGFHPAYPPHLFAQRGADGGMEFVPPASIGDYRENRLPALPETESKGQRVERELRKRSYLIDRWFREYVDPWTPWVSVGPERVRALERRAALIGLHPLHASFARGWGAEEPFETPWARFLEENPPSVHRDALDVMRFALEQFRERAERDGAALVVLASHTLGGGGDALFELLRGLAADVGGEGIPVISQYDHVVAAGGKVAGLHWAHDSHWNATGHRRAAEAILEWLKEHPEVCD